MGFARDLANGQSQKSVEWPTWLAILGCYGLWCTLTVAAGTLLPIWMALAALAILAAFHASLQHEALHGHPTRNASVNEGLVFFSLGLFLPYRRVKTLHLRHHCDERLTDPYDDPESFYRAERDWAQTSAFLRLVLQINNTLLGRVIFGPALALHAFLKGEVQLLKAGNRQVALAWGLHLASVACVCAWLAFMTALPLWLYLLAVAYPAFSLLMIRTFAEHRAHETVGGRTVVVEKGGPFALLFLNNNLHIVHHMHPRAPWYRLPALYRADRNRYLEENSAYVFESYGAILRAHLVTRKEPVVHPLVRRSAMPPDLVAGAGAAPLRGDGGPLPAVAPAHRSPTD
ncbi:MAG: fatty acid desaturase [Pseudomonadota bacterium]